MQRSIARPASILVRGVNWLGDAVMSTPGLLRLREAFPNARITILTPDKLADLWRHHPAVDSVVPFTGHEGPWTMARQLREGTFDLAVVLPNSFRSAFEIWLARIPQRVGYQGQWRRGLLTQAVPRRSGVLRMRKRSIDEIRSLLEQTPRPSQPNPAGSHHQIHEYLHLVSVLGANPDPLAPRIEVSKEEVRDFLDQWEIPLAARRPLLGLNPGAEYGPAKRWLPENFVSAALEIQRQTDCQWLILGGPADAALAAEIKVRIETALEAEMPLPNRKSQIANPKSEISSVINLAGRTSLRELCAGLKACRVLLTNDTGPMHVAAALGTPVVALFGSTSPQLTGPGLTNDLNHRVLSAGASCSPCFLRECPIDFRCMKHIAVEEVVQAVVERVVAGHAKHRHEGSVQ